MKMRTLVKIAFFAVIVVACIPLLRSQSRFEVEVNWSFREAVPTSHEVTIQGLTFTVPAGKTVKQTLELKGGSNAAILYAVRGWGFIGQELTVDGEKIPLQRIHSTDKRGTLVILWMSRSPSMDAEIVIRDQT